MEITQVKKSNKVTEAMSTNAWRIARTTKLFRNSRILSQYVCADCYSNRCITQVRYMSDGRKGFFQQIYDNIKEGISKDKELNENLRKFQEEKKKLETSDAIKKARQKFESIESETSKGSEVFKKGFEDVKEKVSGTFEEVQKTEFVKKGLEITEEIGKTAGKAGETIIKQGQKLSESAPIKTVSSGVKAVKKDIDEVALSRAEPYKRPEKLRMRTAKLNSSEDFQKSIEPDNESVGVVLHKDSKWSQTWQNFKDNNEYINKLFDLKMRYDESDNVVIRASRTVTDKISYLFGGMFTKSEMTEVLDEICKIDPNFETQNFILWCQKRFIPNLLEAMIRGEEEVLKDWCYEAPFNVLMHQIKKFKELGYVFDSRILDVNDVDVVMGKLVEQGPVLFVRFNAQVIEVYRNAKGEVVEGDPNTVQRVTHVWVLCRDQEEFNPEIAWRVLEWQMAKTEQFL